MELGLHRLAPRKVEMEIEAYYSIDKILGL